LVKEKSRMVFAEVNRVIEEERSLTFAESGDIFLVNGTEVEVKDIMRQFTDNFHNLQLGSLKLESGLDLEEFGVFIRLLSRTERLSGDKQIKQYLKERGVNHIVPLFASYRLVKEDERIIKEGGILNLQQVPAEIIEQFCRDLNKGEVANQIEKQERIYQLLAHDPDFLSRQAFDLVRNKDDPKELEKILWLIGDYLIGEVGTAKKEEINRKILNELESRLLSLWEREKDKAEWKEAIQEVFTKINAALELKGLTLLYQKHKKGLETAAEKLKGILDAIPAQSQLYLKAKENLRAIGPPRLDETIFRSDKE